MDKGIIYYTDGLLPETIKNMVMPSIRNAGLPVIESTPESVGGTRSYPTMVKQIIYCLEKSITKYVFFCEHDVLYDSSHFEFTPAKDDVFYYNAHNWRWQYPLDRFITYDGLLSLSGLCCNRELALAWFRKRLELVVALNWDSVEGKEKWMLQYGYEPGLKGEAAFETWRSEGANIDIRHDGTWSRKKTKLTDFNRQPTNWKEATLKDI